MAPTKKWLRLAEVTAIGFMGETIKPSNLGTGRGELKNQVFLETVYHIFFLKEHKEGLRKKLVDIAS